MATVQTVFDQMELRWDRLNLQSNEEDVDAGISAINAAIDQIESVISSHPSIEQTYTTVTTTASQEYTDHPARLLRIDSMWFENTDGTPRQELEPLMGVSGSPVSGLASFLGQPGTAEVSGYTVSKDRFYWSPIPAGTYTIRVYGFYGAADLTAATDTFPLPDPYLQPVASVATRYMQNRVEATAQQDARALALEEAGPILNMRRKMWRHMGAPMRYFRPHIT